MEVIFLLGASQAFFLSFLGFSKKNKSKADFVLAFWLIIMGLQLLDHYFYSTGFSARYPHLLGMGILFPLIQGPFMFVYVLVMVNKSGKFKPEYWLHAIPFLIFLVYLIFDYYFLSAPEKLIYYQNQLIKESPMIALLGKLSVTIGPAYLIWSLIKLRKHIKTIANDFSYTEEIDLKWLKYVLAGMGFVWITVVFTNLISDYPLFDTNLKDSFIYINNNIKEHLIYIAVTVAVFFLGYFGIKQQAIYKITDEDVKKDVKKHHTKKNEGERYKHSGLKKDVAEIHLKELLEYIESEKPYLNGKLSLKEVAYKLNISVNHLSQIINEQLNKSFFDFINGYRVDEVISRLSDPKNEQYTLLAISYDSGFNSKSSFNSIFKKFTDLTPSEYLKQK